MKLTVPLTTMERSTWITIAESLGVGAVLLAAPGITLRALVGLPLLFHLTWTAATSLPTGQIPGPPEGVGERRQNHHLRSRVRMFLREVQRAEQLVREARTKGLPRRRVKQSLQLAEKRLLSTASEVGKALGLSGT